MARRDHQVAAVSVVAVACVAIAVMTAFTPSAPIDIPTGVRVEWIFGGRYRSNCALPTHAFRRLEAAYDSRVDIHATGVGVEPRLGNAFLRAERFSGGVQYVDVIEHRIGNPFSRLPRIEITYNGNLVEVLDAGSLDAESRGLSHHMAEVVDSLLAHSSTVAERRDR